MAALLCTLLAFKQVSEATAQSRTTLYRKIKEGTFPRPVSLGKNCVRWRSDDIAAWIEAQTTQPEASENNTIRARIAVAARQKKRATAAQATPKAVAA